MILIINKSRKEAESLAGAFRYIGIVARGETPERANAEVSTLYRVILIVDPEKLPDEGEYITRLRSYIGDIPIIALTPSFLRISLLRKARSSKLPNKNKTSASKRARMRHKGIL